MFALLHSRFSTWRQRRGLSARISPLVLLLQRSPLVKLVLPEARVLSASGFSDIVKWVVTAVAGLGAFDSVTGASTVTQLAPSPNSSTVSATAGQALVFFYQYGGADTPDHFQVIGTLPSGLTQTNNLVSKTDSITGVPVVAGNFPITIRAWRDAAQALESVAANFTLNIAPPPAPTITSPPAGGNFSQGDFVSMVVGHTSGFSFTWKRDGSALPNADNILFSRSAPRRFLFPVSDPGTNWRSGAAFDDSTWTAVSGGIGYDTVISPVNYLPHIAPGGNVQAQMSGAGKPTSVFLRLPFVLSTPAALSYLKLRVQCDDGFVAWLNGTEVASQNKPGTLLWTSTASTTATDADAVNFRDIDISPRLGLLRTGSNLLAVQALNQANTSSDLLFNAELAGGINATNSARLIFTSVQPADSGTYTVTVANPTNSVTSDGATLNLLASISSHPASVAINSGGTAALTVIATGTAPFSYQWYRGISGDTSDPIAGAVDPSFSTPALTTTTSFWVRVTNAASSVDSHTAVVTVGDVPLAISTQPGSVSINSGQSTTLQVAATGAAPFSYQWFQGISGDTSNPVAGANGESFTTPILAVTTSYWVRVTNAVSSADSHTVVVTVSSTVPDSFSAWQNGNFTAAQIADPAISGPGADPDADGNSNDHEYIFGTLPLVEDSPFAPAMTADGSNVGFAFTAHRATGAGYDGRTRHYAIESSTDPTRLPWETLTGFSDIIGDDQTVNFNQAMDAGRRFFRLKVWLTP